MLVLYGRLTFQPACVFRGLNKGLNCVCTQVEAHPGRHRPLTCRPIAQPPPRPRHDLARHLRRLHHPLSTCCLASRWKEDMAFLRSFYVADDIWRFA